MTNPQINESNKVLDQLARYILIEISYDMKLLLPIEEGNEFLRLYSQARTWKEKYQEPISIEPMPPEIKIRYITQREIAKIGFDAALGIKDDE
jgi:hypothetical protein